MKVPVPLLAKVTVPVGALAVPGEVSVTVAVQVTALLTTTVEGLQLTLVLVRRSATISVAIPELAA